MSVEIITLTDPGGSTARVQASFGFNCFEFRAGADAADLLWAEPEFESGNKRASGSGIPLLFPFPGRMPGQLFVWQNKEFRLPSNDGRGNAIHGFVLDRPWRVVAQTATRVEGEFHAAKDAPELLSRWPTDFKIRVAYALSANSLQATFTIENPDQQPLPFGLGTHPYFRLPAGPVAEDCVLQVPVREEWELVDMLPTGHKSANDSCLALTDGGKIAGREFDRVFTGLRFGKGVCTTMIDDPTNRRRVWHRFDEVFRECVLYTPPHREAICIEPYTCLPGGQGLASHVDTGWRVLAPSDSLTANFEIEVEDYD